MNCNYRKHIDCQDGKDCSTCGWNPKVEQKRKNRIKVSREISEGTAGINQMNLAKRLRDYQEKATADCFGLLAALIGGEVTGDILKNISHGFMPWLQPGDLMLIDEVLRQIERQGDG